MLQFGSKHVCIEDVHIFKHCHEMTRFLLWIGTYCISCVVQQTSGVKDLSSLVRYDDSCCNKAKRFKSIIPVVPPRPNIRSHSVLYPVSRARARARPENCVIFIGCNFESRASQVGLHKQENDTGSDCWVSKEEKSKLTA